MIAGAPRTPSAHITYTGGDGEVDLRHDTAGDDAGTARKVSVRRVSAVLSCAYIRPSVNPPAFRRPQSHRCTRTALHNAVVVRRTSLHYDIYTTFRERVASCIDRASSPHFRSVPSDRRARPFRADTCELSTANMLTNYGGGNRPSDALIGEIF